MWDTVFKHLCVDERYTVADVQRMARATVASSTVRVSILRWFRKNNLSEASDTPLDTPAGWYGWKLLLISSEVSKQTLEQCLTRAEGTPFAAYISQRIQNIPEPWTNVLLQLKFDERYSVANIAAMVVTLGHKGSRRTIENRVRNFIARKSTALNLPSTSDAKTGRQYYWWGYKLFLLTEPTDPTELSRCLALAQEKEDNAYIAYLTQKLGKDTQEPHKPGWMQHGWMYAAGFVAVLLLLLSLGDGEPNFTHMVGPPPVLKRNLDTYPQFRHQLIRAQARWYASQAQAPQMPDLQGAKLAFRDFPILLGEHLCAPGMPVQMHDDTGYVYDIREHGVVLAFKGGRLVTLEIPKHTVLKPDWRSYPVSIPPGSANHGPKILTLLAEINDWTHSDQLPHFQIIGNFEARDAEAFIDEIGSQIGITLEGNQLIVEARDGPRTAIGFGGIGRFPSVVRLGSLFDVYAEIGFQVDAPESLRHKKILFAGEPFPTFLKDYGYRVTLTQTRIQILPPP